MNIWFSTKVCPGEGETCPRPTLLVSAEISRINLSNNLKTGIGRNFKNITGCIPIPIFAPRQLHGQGATNNGHHFFLARTELILTRADDAHSSWQFCTLKGNRLHFSVEVFVYVQHSCYS